LFTLLFTLFRTLPPSTSPRLEPLAKRETRDTRVFCNLVSSRCPAIVQNNRLATPQRRAPMPCYCAGHQPSSDKVANCSAVPRFPFCEGFEAWRGVPKWFREVRPNFEGRFISKSGSSIVLSRGLYYYFEPKCIDGSKNHARTTLSNHIN